MASDALIKKLLLKPGQRIKILNAPQGYWDELGSLPAGIILDEQSSDRFDFVQLFVKDRAELERFAAIAMQIVKPTGVLWISYPKGGAKAKTDINRDILWKLLENTGFRPVTQIAINDIWSALRFRPVELVESRKR